MNRRHGFSLWMAALIVLLLVGLALLVLGATTYYRPPVFFDGPQIPLFMIPDGGAPSMAL